MDSTVLIPGYPKNIIIAVFTGMLKNSAFAYSLEELAKTACDKNEYVKSYLLGRNKNYNNHKCLLKIENNRKLRSTYELLIENPNIKRVQEKPIVLQRINSNPASLSDTTDTTDIPKNKTNFNMNNNGVSSDNIPSDRSDRSEGCYPYDENKERNFLY